MTHWNHLPGEKKESIFFNERVSKEDSHDGRSYMSKGEAYRSRDLQLLEKGGQISKLRYQVPFDLDINGVHICKYIADYCYQDGEKSVVEDFKGLETKEFKLKWKMMQALYPHLTYRISRREFKNDFHQSRLSELIKRKTG